MSIDPEEDLVMSYFDVLSTRSKSEIMRVHVCPRLHRALEEKAKRQAAYGQGPDWVPPSRTAKLMLFGAVEVMKSDFLREGEFSWEGMPEL